MSCAPFSNREPGWLPGEQTLLLHMFLSKPSAELANESPPGCARSRKLLTLFVASVSATKKRCLAISCERASLPHASHRACFVLSPLSEQDCAWEERITAPGAQAHPWQSAAEERAVKHRQGWTCTVCLWCKCSQAGVARMGSVECSACEWRPGALQEHLGGDADRDVTGCLLLKSFTTCWTSSRESSYPISSSEKLIHAPRGLSTYVYLVAGLLVKEALNLLLLTLLEASALMGSVGWAPVSTP